MSVDVKSLLNHPEAAGIIARPGSFIVRAPGRVNLIGEHTDYNGLPVLPMAVDRDIVIVAAPSDDSVTRLINAQTSFTPREFEARADVEPFKQGDWGNYAKASAVAVSNWAKRDSIRGFVGLVAGDVPPGSGMSSSSAMVVACALAFLQTNGLSMPKDELSELLAKGERYVGTEGGGMDQTVSLMGEEGKALRIDFYPIRTRPIQLPAGYSVVVCNSLIKARKSGPARNAYNTRVVECRTGLAMLRKALAGELPADFSPKLLGDLMKPESGVSSARILEAVETLPERVSGDAEAAGLLGWSEADATELRRLRDGSLLPIPEGGLKLRSRARHVFTEALRVEKAASVSDGESFGALMNASHASCAGDYEVSCPELDALVQMAREAGALGARLTGAGFGGCAIALVADDSVSTFIEAVSERYYRDYIPKSNPKIKVPDDLSTVIFACKPAGGAGKVELQ